MVRLIIIFITITYISVEAYSYLHKKISHKNSRCLRDSQCGKKQSCNLWLKMCERCKFNGELCRRRENCCNKELQCLWGKCQEPLGTKGYKRHSCHSNKDCKPGLCCAKIHGVKVCRPQLQEFQICTNYLGGIDHSINHKCPCENHLHCVADTNTNIERCRRML